MKKGFTIVELLIVVVVIAILAAITIVSYNGITTRANQSKMQGDLRNLAQAIQAARTIKNTSLGAITENWATGGQCTNKPAGTDLATVAKSDLCWSTYTTTLDKISIASGMNVRNLVDPWGRPYVIDENETEAGPAHCVADYIGAYRRPVDGWNRLDGTNINIPLFTPGCV